MAILLNLVKSGYISVCELSHYEQFDDSQAFCDLVCLIDVCLYILTSSNVALRIFVGTVIALLSPGTLEFVVRGCCLHHFHVVNVVIRVIRSVRSSSA